MSPPANRRRRTLEDLFAERRIRIARATIDAIRSGLLPQQRAVIDETRSRLEPTMPDE